MNDARHSLREIDELAAGWVGRCDAGLTPAEAAELEAWRHADPSHAAALKRFESVWSAADGPRESGVAELLRHRLDVRARRKRLRRSALGAGLAGCLVLAAGLWVGIRGGDKPADVEVHTAFLGPVRQMLPDGSIAEYTRGTHLTVEFSGDTRRVTFVSGEAHFEVVHNPERPFIVTAGGLAVRAVGTAFAVQVGSASTAVVVTAGRVAVSAKTAAVAPSVPEVPLALVDAGQSIDVRPASSGAAPVVVALPAAEMAERLAWRNRRVEFSSASLAEVVAVVNRHNRVQFSIDDSALAVVRLSGVFRLDDPEELARLLESSFPITIERPTPGRILLRPRN